MSLPRKADEGILQEFGLNNSARFLAHGHFKNALRKKTMLKFRRARKIFIKLCFRYHLGSEQNWAQLLDGATAPASFRLQTDSPHPAP